jgi:hypothetical protein
MSEHETSETIEIDTGLAQVASSGQTTIQQFAETLVEDVANTEYQAEPPQPKDTQHTSAAQQSETVPARGELDALKRFGQRLLVLFQKLKHYLRCGYMS